MGRLLRFPAHSENRGDGDNETLRGLGGVAVVMEALDPPLEDAGLDLTALQRAVERHLSEAGVQVFTQQQAEDSNEAGYLLVAFAADVHQTGVLACMLNLQLCESAVLPRLPDLGGGVTTWCLNGVWAFDKQPLAHAFDEVLAAGLERFVGDYRQANA